jgi:hypothetical protein
MKKTQLGWWPSVHDANVTLLWTHVKNQLPNFPQATSLTPSPSLPPFTSHTHICDTILPREDDIGTSDVFFIQYKCTINRCRMANGSHRFAYCLMFTSGAISSINLQLMINLRILQVVFLFLQYLLRPVFLQLKG